MNILFRADSSSIIGIGHIMRDLVLASKYKDSNIIFAMQNLDGNINNKILNAKYKIEILKSNSINEVIDLINIYKIDMIVIDHYGIDYKYEIELKEKTGVKIFVLDDTYEKHYCDILLNHNISADKKRYKNLVPKQCELRCGSKYTLIRNEFLEEKKKVIKRLNNATKIIFVAMGGADMNNISLKILEVLEDFKNIEVNLATTTANPNIEVLKKYIKSKKYINLHINSNEIAKLINSSDFAIISPSVMVHEVLYMGIPFIAIKTASNQNDMYEYLKNEKYLVLDKFKQSIIRQIEKLDLSNG